MENVKKLFRCISLLLLYLSFGTVGAYADTVRGTVVDDTGEPLIGVTVLLQGTSQGVATDFDGQCSKSENRSARFLVCRHGLAVRQGQRTQRG